MKKTVKDMVKRFGAPSSQIKIMKKPKPKGSRT